MMMSTKQQLLDMLDGSQAHVTFEAAVEDLPESLRGVVPKGLPYSAWQIVEHIRIAQRDILEFSRNSDGRYQPMKWPEDYWPAEVGPPSASAWDESIANVLGDRKSFESLLRAADDEVLLQPFPWGQGESLLREALLILDHAGYHTGELIVLRRLLGAWPA